MQINGYKIRAAIKRATRNRDILQARFLKETNYFASKGDKPDIFGTGSDLDMIESVIVRLQILQMQYNLAITVKVNGFVDMSLAAAVKHAGTRARIAAQWRKIAGEKPNSRADRYGYASVDQLNKETEYALPTITPEAALERENCFNLSHAAFQEAIAEGNSQSIEISDADLNGLGHLFV